MQFLTSPDFTVYKAVQVLHQSVWKNIWIHIGSQGKFIPQTVSPPLKPFTVPKVYRQYIIHNNQQNVTMIDKQQVNK